MDGGRGGAEGLGGERWSMDDGEFPRHPSSPVIASEIFKTSC